VDQQVLLARPDRRVLLATPDPLVALDSPDQPELLVRLVLQDQLGHQGQLGRLGLLVPLEHRAARVPVEPLE